MANFAMSLPLLMAMVLLVTITGGESISEIAVELNQVDGPSVEANYNLDNEGNHPTGILSLLSNFGELYTIKTLGTSQSPNVVKHQFQRNGTNSTSNPFFGDDDETEGSADGTSFPTPLGHNTAFDVLHHHAYISHNNDIIILNLNLDQATPSGETTTADYITLSLGHNATQIKAHNIHGEHYISVYYEEGESGYARLFRRYPNEGWGSYGRPEAIVSASWYTNSHLLSNVLLYSPPEDYYSQSYSTSVAVAYTYFLHVDDLIDRSYYSVIIPNPCNTVEHLIYNSPNQLLFVVCPESSHFYNYTNREFYDHGAPLEGVTGIPYFNHNGKFAALVSNSNDSYTSNITVIKIAKQSSTVFHHLTHSMVAQATFVDVGPSKRHFCYIEIGPQGSIQCIDVTSSFSNDSVVMREVPNSQGLCPSENSSCPSLYTHHSLLVAQNCTNDDECEDGIRVFDLTTFTNVWNVTGVEPILMTWRSLPRQPNTATTTYTNAPTESQTTSPPTTTSTSEQPSESTTETLSNPSTPSLFVTPKLDSTLTATEGEQFTLEVCQAQLSTVNRDYDRLLWITIGICVFFCVALVVTVGLSIAVISVSRVSTQDSGSAKKKSR